MDEIWWSFLYTTRLKIFIPPNWLGSYQPWTGGRGWSAGRWQPHPLLISSTMHRRDKQQKAIDSPRRGLPKLHGAFFDEHKVKATRAQKDKLLPEMSIYRRKSAISRGLFLLELIRKHSRTSVSHYAAHWHAGCCWDPLPLRLSRTANVACSAAVFFTYLISHLFPHLAWRFRPQVTSGQVTSSGQVTLPPKKLVMLQ